MQMRKNGLKTLLSIVLLCTPYTFTNAYQIEASSPQHKSEQWLAIAEHDLKAAELIMQVAPELFDIALYHAQQCAEKALKAFLVHKNRRVPRTHNLIDVVYLCKKIDDQFQSLVSATQELNPFSTRLRYPHNQKGVPTIHKAFELVHMAQEIFYFVQNKIILAAEALPALALAN